MLKSRIISLKNEYTKMDCRISEYIINNYNEKTAKSSITQLSNKMNVSPAALTRFCQKIKLRGFKEFQNELFNELESIKEKPNEDSVMLNDIISSLKRTEKILDEEEIKLVANKIWETKNVYVYGEAFTHLMAQTLSRKLNKINIPSTPYNVASDFGMILPKENSVHIFVSTSGQNPNIRRVVKKITSVPVKKQMIVSITASEFTNIEEFENSHIHGLFYDTDINDPYELPSTTGHVIKFIQDKIYKEVYKKNLKHNDDIILELTQNKGKR